MPLIQDPQVTFDAFVERFPNRTGTKDEVTQFINEYFLPAGSDVSSWTPPDWLESPPFLDTVTDHNLKIWGSSINCLWKFLGKQLSDDVRIHPERHSLLPVTEPFVVPGGRFREWYYWDSFWIIRGLVSSGLFNTSRGMISNFLEQVNQHGFVPNGGRMYYLDRTQPPLLTQMVSVYFDATNDVDFLLSAYPLLNEEYQFWMANRSVNLISGSSNYQLNHFNAHVNTPRPEGWVEDVANAAGLDAQLASLLYHEIATGAESGWDFSSRWFKEPLDMSTIRISHLLPVDLNSMMYKNEICLALMAERLGDSQAAIFYRNAARVRLEAMEMYLWSEQAGMWLDYDYVEHATSSDRFYISNFLPLWAGAFPQTGGRLERVLQTLQDSGALNYVGVPTSFIPSGQQWDFPNAWAPLQMLLIEALNSNSRTSSLSSSLALALAQNWVNTNYAAWYKTYYMYEKYNVTAPGTPGGGGEYVPQAGFGWTNGVIIELLGTYGDKLTAPMEPPHTRSPPRSRDVDTQWIDDSFSSLHHTRTILAECAPPNM